MVHRGRCNIDQSGNEVTYNIANYTAADYWLNMLQAAPVIYKVLVDCVNLMYILLLSEFKTQVLLLMSMCALRCYDKKNV